MNSVDYIDIPIPVNKDDLLGYFIDQKKNGQFEKALVIDPLAQNARAVVDEVSITAVDELDNGDVEVSHEVDYSWYYGCSDADGGDGQIESVVGVKMNGFWRFDMFTPTPERDTCDEF